MTVVFERVKNKEVEGSK